MFLAIYRFEGNTEQLKKGYDQMVKKMPSGNMQLHVCVADTGGLWIYDTCPNREAFESFSNGSDFHDLLKACDLPAPRVTPVGNVHAAFVNGSRTG